MVLKKGSFMSRFKLIFINLSFFYTSLIFIFPIAAAEKPLSKTSSIVVKCKVEFAPSGTKVDVSLIENCFNSVDQEDTVTFDLFTNPPPLIENSKNIHLWKKRSGVLTQVLKALYPKSQVNARSGRGVEWLTDGSLIVATVHKQATKKEGRKIVLPQTAPELAPKPVAVEKTPPYVVQSIIIQQAAPVQYMPATTAAVATAPSGTCPLAGAPINLNDRKEAFPTRIWFGTGYYYMSGDITTYLPQFSSGYVAGLSQSFYRYSEQNQIYFSLTSDFDSVGKSTLLYGSYINVLLYMVNVDILFGLEHNFNRYFSLYGDMGPVLMQRSFFVINAATGLPNNYQVFTTFGLGVNIGMNITYDITSLIGIFAKFNLNGIYGSAKTTPIQNANSVVIGQVNMNPMLVIPSISLGVRF